MKFLGTLVVVMFFTWTSNAVLPEQEYLTPADTMTMKIKTIPCYKIIRQGNTNKVTRVAITGDRCPSNTSSLPQRQDRPELGAEPESPGQIFKKRME